MAKGAKRPFCAIGRHIGGLVFRIGAGEDVKET